MQVWKHGLQHIAEVCLEGLSRVKACNAVGRAAMTSDVQDLGYSLKGLLQPLPKELAAQLENSLRLVDMYIKVYSTTHTWDVLLASQYATRNSLKNECKSRSEPYFH